MKKEKQPLEWTYEIEYNNKGVVMCGTDEAGRGPLAGRVYAAAVVLDEKFKDDPVFKALDDSKKLTEKKRFEIAPKIKELALSSCVAYSTVAEIEEINILNAALLAMRRAISGLSLDRNLVTGEFLSDNCMSFVGGKQVDPGFAVVDGPVCRDFQIPAMALVHGDAICPSVAAASVLAKTERDLYCIDFLDKTYPGYGFAKHKGYGTKAHYAAIASLGPCHEHRLSFLH